MIGPKDVDGSAVLEGAKAGAGLEDEAHAEEISKNDVATSLEKTETGAISDDGIAVEERSGEDDGQTSITLVSSDFYSCF